MEKVGLVKVSNKLFSPLQSLRKPVGSYLKTNFFPPAVDHDRNNAVDNADRRRSAQIGVT